MFSKELENLIAASIADGVLTDQEKRVLIKRAENEGVDLDELEVYIDSLLHNQRVAKDEAELQEIKSREQWHGIVKKCPQCGTPVEAGMGKCKACGYEFSGLEANKQTEKLSDKLNQIAVTAYKTSYDKDSAISLVIKSFPISSAKEDLLDLIMTLKRG